MPASHACSCGWPAATSDASWCDTPYAFNEGQKMSVDDVLQQVDRYGSPLVEVTGGEPLLQEDVYPLMERLLDSGRTVLLETGGQIDVSRVPGGVVKVMDVKCPASGESDKVEWANIDRLGSRDQVKFVIQDRGRLRVCARHRDATRARSTMRRGAVLARARRAEPERSVRVDSRGSAAGPSAAADPQAHLGRECPRRLARPSCC